MKLDRAKNTQKNIVFGLYSKLISILFPFIIRTVIINKLGAEYLGLSSLFSSILTVLNLSELGFSTAIIFSMYKPIAENDEKTICALLAFYRKVYRWIGMLILCLGVGIMPFLKYIINGEYPQNINIYLLYCIYLGNTVISYLLFAYKNSILNAFQRTDLVSKNLMISQSLMYILQLIILFTVKNYYIYAFMLPVSTCINNILVSYVVDKNFPQYVCKGKIDKVHINEIKKQVSGLMMHKICQVTRNSFDNIFISMFLGLTITAQYGNYYYIMSAVISFLGIITNAIVAGVGNSIALESREKNYNDMVKINFIYMWIVGVCTACLLCLYQPFMEIWVGKELKFSYTVVILLVIYFYAWKMGDIRAVYTEAAGLWWENRYRAITEAILNILLNFVLGKLYGIYGIIIATIITITTINYGWGTYIPFKYYFKNRKYIKYNAGQIKYAIVTCIVCFVTKNICDLVKITNIEGLIVKLFICVLVSNLFFLILYFKTKEFKEALNWILTKIEKQKR